ncbi:OsmC family peroxiredoxin, partial [Streptomyces sp. NPDC006386]|uniref:OsmC family peroxiredoxin n=1 Tax=Streptomyces sp. NPDC006386 TaxID=3156762 RepID=UPI0033BE00E1
MATTRSAHTVWEGNLFKGNGVVTFDSSGILSEQPVSWAARTEEPGGKTSPEELIAAAHSSCFSMAFSNILDKAGEHGRVDLGQPDPAPGTNRYCPSPAPASANSTE